MSRLRRPECRTSFQSLGLPERDTRIAFAMSLRLLKIIRRLVLICLGQGPTRSESQNFNIAVQRDQHGNEPSR